MLHGRRQAGRLRHQRGIAPTMTSTSDHQVDHAPGAGAPRPGSPGSGASSRACGRPHLPARVAVEGHRRGARAGEPPRPPGHGLRGAGRAAGDHRPLHLDPVPGRVRHLRAVADPGPGPGLGAGLDDRRDGPAARGRQRRPGDRRRLRVGARADGRRADAHRRGRRASASSPTCCPSRPRSAT